MSGSESIQRGETAWRVKEPDEAKYNFSDEKGVWQPKPEDILSLFEKLAQGNPLPLKWTCPGRRPPETNVKSDKNSQDGLDMDDDDSKEEELRAPETSAFDFDEQFDVNAKLIPKRAPGGLGRTPKTEKRVARMDNIMKSLHKQHLQRTAEREARKAKGSPSSTPPSRSRLLNFGSGSSKYVSSAASSPRFTGSNTVNNSSPLLNRGSTFMSPTTTTRKSISKPGINDPKALVAASDTRIPEMSSMQMNAPQGSSFDSSETRSEQVNILRDLDESVGSKDEVSSATAQNTITTSTVTATLGNATANNYTKPNSSNPFTSTISSSKDVASNQISNSPIMSLDKEFLPADLISSDSNQQFMSSSTRASASTTNAVTISTTSVVIATTASETHPAGVPNARTSNMNQNDLEMNLENTVSDASVQNHTLNLTESVTLSANSVNPETQN